MGEGTHCGRYGASWLGKSQSAGHGDEEDVKWYEVEVQLGETDASHIIRTIEYWDED